MKAGKLEVLAGLHKLAIVLTLTLLVGLGGLGAFTSAQVAATTLTDSMAQGQVKQLKESLPTTVHESTPKVVDGTEAVIAFQGKLQQAANSRGVLVEFESTGDPAPFMTRFANGAPEADWKQSELQLSIVGPTRETLELLDSVKTFEIPFEFGDMDIQRTTMGMTSVITIRTQIRVLNRS